MILKISISHQHAKLKSMVDPSSVNRVGHRGKPARTKRSKTGRGKGRRGRARREKMRIGGVNSREMNAQTGQKMFVRARTPQKIGEISGPTLRMGMGGRERGTNIRFARSKVTRHKPNFDGVKKIESGFNYRPSSLATVLK